jgi:polyisoprenoid-binding protein YceI
MLKRTLAIVVVVTLVALGLSACLLLSAPEEASAPIEAIPVVGKAQENQPEASNAETNLEKAEVNESAEPNQSNAEEAVDSRSTVFEIVSAESEARFVIDEILRGSPFTVVGVTDQVAAEFTVNPANLSTARIGPVLINARTLATDNNLRNRAIKNFILSTDQYEFINFIPTEVVGLKGSGTIGESYDFQIIGDLIIRDVSRQVTFEATATAISETQIEGFATTTILRADYDLTIPQVPQVAGVDEEVVLEIDFVAVAKDQLNQG